MFGLDFTEKGTGTSTGWTQAVLATQTGTKANLTIIRMLKTAQCSTVASQFLASGTTQIVTTNGVIFVKWLK